MMGKKFYLSSGAQESICNEDSRYYNKDLAPTIPSARSWKTYNVASMWVSLCFCVPAYMIASGLIASGLNWWQALSNVLLGNLTIMFVIMLNSNVGIKYGIPYPIFARLSFGIRGARFAALARGVIGAGWFGINCWIAGQALTCIPTFFYGKTTNIVTDEFAFFAIVIVLCTALCYYGVGIIKRIKVFAAPLLALFFLGLLILFVSKILNAGFSIEHVLNFESGNALHGVHFWSVYLGGLTANMAFWSTLSLNIPDISRFISSQKAHDRGILFSLPLTMLVCSFIGVFVTGASKLLYGSYIWDPVSVLLKTGNAYIVIFGSLAILISTVILNVVANMLATANDISSLWPKYISYRSAVLITCVAGVLIMPWKLMASASSYIFGWLGLYGVALAPLVGILIADYYLLRKKRVDLVDLYSAGKRSRYWYSGGYNGLAFFVWLVSVVPALTGWLYAPLSFMYDSGWIIGAALALILYYAIGSKNSAIKVSDSDWQQMVSKQEAF